MTETSNVSNNTTKTFFVNYRSFLVSKSLVLNMDDYVDIVDYSSFDCNDVNIYNINIDKYIQAKVAFIPKHMEENVYVLTNLTNIKYDPFEIACIAKHFDTNEFKHNIERSLNDMYNFTYNVQMDESNISNNILENHMLYNYIKNKELPIYDINKLYNYDKLYDDNDEEIQPRPIRRSSPCQKLSHYLSKKRKNDKKQNINNDLIEKININNDLIEKINNNIKKLF